jgi:hypothetical protein
MANQESFPVTTKQNDVRPTQIKSGMALNARFAFVTPSPFRVGLAASIDVEDASDRKTVGVRAAAIDDRATVF